MVVVSQKDSLVSHDENDQHGVNVIGKCVSLFQRGYMEGTRPVQADPGFPGGGGTNPPWVYDFAKFPQKLHEIERIWTLEGARPPPPRSANEVVFLLLRLNVAETLSLRQGII